MTQRQIEERVDGTKKEIMGLKETILEMRKTGPIMIMSRNSSTIQLHGHIWPKVCSATHFLRVWNLPSKQK